MIEKNKYWYLRNHQLFEQLTENEIESLCVISSYKEGEKNEMIFFSDLDKKRLYIIKEGMLKICHTDIEGREIITEILDDHDIFGCTSLEKSSSNLGNEYAKALTNKVSLCSFEIEKFKSLLQSNANLSIKYSAMINDKMVSFQQKYSDLIFKDVNTRVAEFFKKYASSHGHEINGRIEMEMILTHQEIADYIASSRQSVTTVINKLAEEGKIIYKGRKKVIIPDIKKL